MQATRITAVRHGETDWNVQRRIQGHTDIALNAAGRAQASKVAHALRGESIDAVYASDLQRAFATGAAIAAAAGAPLVAEPGLRERSFGALESRTFAQIEQAWPEQARRWRKRDPHYAPEGGETLALLRERIAQVLARLAANHTGGHMVVVTHGGVLDMLYRLATGQGIQAARTWQLANAAVNRLLWTPQSLTVVGWGDTRHLDLAGRDESFA